MTAIFLSYRRADTGGYAGRLAEALEKRFGAGSGLSVTYSTTKLSSGGSVK